jgi:hypothetical protein
MRLQLLWPRTYRGVRQWYVLKKLPKPLTHLVLLAQMDDAGNAIRFMLLDGAEYRVLGPWLDEELPPSLETIATGVELVQAVRARLTRCCRPDFPDVQAGGAAPVPGGRGAPDNRTTQGRAPGSFKGTSAEIGNVG